GSITFGLVVAKIMGGPDPRKDVSVNIGAANVYRLLGRNAGAFTLFGDLMKGALPVFLARFGLVGLGGWHEAAVAAVGLAAVAGHIWPLYLGFRGGKAVATSFGVVLVISPLAAAVLAVIYAVVFRHWRISSVASLAAAWCLPPVVGFCSGSKLYLLLAAVLSALVLWRHQENIVRLCRSQEPELRRGGPLQGPVAAAAAPAAEASRD
ncbi:MAG: glycerol-3-phosphate 1-O-acyltransferase PlsY, partial [Desulfobacca sp.]|uniref:glycerol-3-phosphate 1-O-acyltransferase PlsY n=1 Tax=Desulfobacca sp. TaxID=2067990 RepID=UPI00404A618C